MKSREVKRREGWQLIAQVGAVVAGLLILYCLSEGAPTSGIGVMTPLLTVAGTLSGVFLGARLNQRQREEEDERKRRTLATMLLQELRLLEIVLKDIHDSFELEGEGVEPFHTAMYDQFTSELLRLTPDTINQLTYFYQLVHTLRMELNRFRHHPPGSRAWHDAVLKVRATQAALLIKDMAPLLVAEGGIWPRPFPTFMMRTFPPEGPPFPAPTFERSASEGQTRHAGQHIVDLLGGG